MRIFPQPHQSGPRLQFRPVAHPRIRLRAPPRDLNLCETIRFGVSMRIGKTVPAPLRHRQQRRERGILLGKCLQPRNVRRKTKTAIADHQRRMRINRRQPHIVPRHQSMAIDGLCGGGLGDEQHAQHKQQNAHRLIPIYTSPYYIMGGRHAPARLFKTRRFSPKLSPRHPRSTQARRRRSRRAR